MEVKDAAHRRLLVTGDIRMPILPVDAFGFGIGVDRQDLGMSLRSRRPGVDMQFAEIPTEPLVGVHTQRLITKEQYLMLRQRLMQLLDLTVAEWLRQRDAFDVGADARRHRGDRDGCIAHGTASRWWTRT